MAIKFVDDESSADKVPGKAAGSRPTQIVTPSDKDPAGTQDPVPATQKARAKKPGKKIPPA